MRIRKSSKTPEGWKNWRGKRRTFWGKNGGNLVLWLALTTSWGKARSFDHNTINVGSFQRRHKRNRNISNKIEQTGPCGKWKIRVKKKSAGWAWANTYFKQLTWYCNGARDAAASAASVVFQPAQPLQRSPSPSQIQAKRTLGSMWPGKIGCPAVLGMGGGPVGWKMGASAVPKKNIIKSNQSEDADAATAHESKIN